ncbi:hypothetical protein FB451DRAFT_451648 [Mycena latifolia]|nr:hypothetical protein FB451DRAFT_451648 [Mycena latifolia]
MLYKIPQLLQSTSDFDNRELRWELQSIVRNLASHSKSTRAAVIEPLMALLRGSDMNGVALGFDSLWRIADLSGGAEGVVAANTLPYLLDGLGSPSSSVREEVCRLTIALARHQSTAAAVTDLNPCKQLVAISGDMGTLQELVASSALVTIANWPDGAEAAVAAHVLEHVPKWFASPDYETRRLACQLLEKLARHKSTAGAVMDPKLCAQLVTILELWEVFL